MVSRENTVLLNIRDSAYETHVTNTLFKSEDDYERT